MKTVAQMMDIVLAELVSELRRRDSLDQLCISSLFPGEAVPADYGTPECGGMAWVMLESSHPTVSFPDQDLTMGNCTASLAYNLSLGIFRPAVLPKEGGRQGIILPTAEENSGMVYQQLDDLEAMRQAVISARRHIDFILMGVYTPSGPEGGIYGGSWTFTAGNEDPD